MASIYIHIPFCRSKCAYCDFASYPGRDRDMARYLFALQAEMRERAAQYGAFPVETVFIGGGTPSLLSGEQMLDLCDELRASFDLSVCTEFTIEANPGTVTPKKLQAYREAGANRISFGAQAMQSDLLESIGRAHRWPDVVAAVKMARNAGFDAINLDLMCGLPGQTKAHFIETLGAAVSLGVAHLSCYSLILEENTPLYHRVQSENEVLPDENSVLSMLELAKDCLAASGLEQYEISNYAKPGYECVHNIVYWTRGDYLGLGCAAHSLMKNERFENDRSIDGYMQGKLGLNRQKLSLEEQREEAILLATRMIEGLDLVDYEMRYGENFLQAHGPSVDRLRSLGLIECAGGRLRLTREGLNVQNAVVVELVGS